MKRVALLILSLALGACSLNQESAYENNHGTLGLYVAATNIYVDSVVGIKNDATGEMTHIKVMHLSGNDTGFLVASLPPGRYDLVAYTPDNQQVLSLESPNAWFEVQSGCFNYGGSYAFGGDAGITNTTTLQDVAQLPPELRKDAAGQDLCDAGMGKAGERLKAADVAAAVKF